MLQNLSKWTETRGAFLFVLCISAVLKISAALTNAVINPDGILYISVAKQFALGNFGVGMALYPLPAYSFLIAIVHFLIPNWVAAAKLISITASILVLIPLYLLAKDLFDRKAAFWGCLAFAVAPFPNLCAVEVIRGPCYLFFFAWAVFFAARAIRSTKLNFFLLAGFFSWFAVLFRIEGIILIPFFLLFLICLAALKPNGRGPFFKGIIIWIAFTLLVVVIFFAAMGPEAASNTAMNRVMRKVQHFYSLGFLDNYHKIYEQLKILEQATFYPGGKQNYAEIARHLMPLVYLLGLFQVFVKVLFPLFVVPLFWAFRELIQRERLFVVALIVSYILLIYYSLIEMDFIQSRFLFAPAFLLYPWIGTGLDRMLAFLMRSPRPRFLVTVFVIIFFVSPVYILFDDVRKQDNIIPVTAEWLANKEEFHKARIITNDPRIPFYAGMENFFLNYPDLNHDYMAMQQVALKNKMDLLVIRASVKRKKLIPQLQSYKKIKEFAGRKDVVIIYRSTEFQEPPGVEPK
jgi:Dolichyl-phosphate-mannose-protein mannosyltransferase